LWLRAIFILYGSTPYDWQMADDRKPQSADKFIVRFPDGMRERIAEEAKANNRTMNAEVVARLTESLNSKPSTDIAPALARLDRDLARLEMEKTTTLIHLLITASTLKPFVTALPPESTVDSGWATFTASELSLLLDVFITNGRAAHRTMNETFDRLRSAQDGYARLKPESVDPFVWNFDMTPQQAEAMNQARKKLDLKGPTQVEVPIQTLSAAGKSPRHKGK
jgi:hypothetical protein